MSNGIVLTAQAEKYLEALAADLEISETRYEQAERSYTSFGAWLHRPASTVRVYDPQVYVQGSFGLGTVIKPISDTEDYDVDVICEFRLLNTANLSQADLKRRLSTEVTSYHDAQAMTKPVREGRRCWILDYADGAQFHMDIVPSVPDGNRLTKLLEQAGQYNSWAGTAIAITDNERWNYWLIHDDWCRSNPKGYKEWFKSRMALEFQKRRRVLAESVHASVEEIPDYRVRTPLQSAIMILKRHRDWRFATDTKNKPISIILTTLAAHSYNSESTIGGALVSILQRMDSYIERVNGKFVIRNPTDPLENFADKWDEFPERKDAFFSWLSQARSDFSKIANLADTQRITETAGASLGKALADRARARATGSNSFLRTASLAPVAGISFPNAPRVPNQPKGFA